MWPWLLPYGGRVQCWFQSKWSWVWLEIDLCFAPLFCMTVNKYCICLLFVKNSKKKGLRKCINLHKMLPPSVANPFMWFYEIYEGNFQNFCKMLTKFNHFSQKILLVKWVLSLSRKRNIGNFFLPLTKIKSIWLTNYQKNTFL